MLQILLEMEKLELLEEEDMRDLIIWNFGVLGDDFGVFAS